MLTEERKRLPLGCGEGGKKTLSRGAGMNSFFPRCSLLLTSPHHHPFSLLSSSKNHHHTTDKSHTCERSRNKYGSLSGADRSTARDAALWDEDDVARRMEFSLRCAHAHGTSALRTHLINMTPRQVELTWPAFDRVRRAWRGRVELQGVSLVALSFFRDREAAEALAKLVASRNNKNDDENGSDENSVVGVLGAAVCCAENGGDPDDEWTTCSRDRDDLLDFFFDLTARHGLSADFHADENGNRGATGLRDVARAVLRRRAKVEAEEKAAEEEAASPSSSFSSSSPTNKTVPFTGTVVCGHCCSLAALTPSELAETLSLVRRANITIVSLPLVNEWTQDRDPRGLRAPRWRGIPPLLEIARLGVRVALASDNVRDQFYSYGDLDALEVLRQGVRAAHLDTPYGSWPDSVTGVPARAMGLLSSSCSKDNKNKKKRTTFGAIAVGGPADFVVFRARAFSELLSRPQSDRVVVRGGRAISRSGTPPPYEELYAEAASVAPPRGFGHREGYGGRLSPAPSLVVAAASGFAASNGGGGSTENGNGSSSAPALASSSSPPPPAPRGLEGEGVLTETRQQRAAAAAVCAFAEAGGVGGGGGGGEEEEEEERAAAVAPRPLASPFKAAAGATSNGSHSLFTAYSSASSSSTSTLVAVGLVGAAAGAALAALVLGRGGGRKS